MAVPALLALTGTGCFRASGLQRTTVVAEAMPELGGDRVAGLKSTAGPGDYYLGNDFIQVAIDGTVFGDAAQRPIAGAAAGGSIVDAGFLSLNTSYQRVNMPADSLERLTPVVNQDPGLELVFDSFTPEANTEPTSLTMTGRILDAGHRIAGATWDASGRVQGLSVVHVITLGKLDRFLTLSTTIVNESGAPVGVRSIGDFLSQTSGGFQFFVPAGVTIAGEPLASNWGAEIPGSDFGNPIATAVQAASVALVATEPSAASFDAHASLGIMSIDAPACMVTSDPQHVLDQAKPVFPKRLVVGGLPLAPAGLAAGGVLSYNRRLYVLGGQSAVSSTPNQPSTIFNAMALAKYNVTNGIWPQDFGTLIYATSGTAIKQGPLPTEIRLERLVGTTLDRRDLWVPERVEWLEPSENLTSQSSFASSGLSDYLPVGTYRLVITNKAGQLIKDNCINTLSYMAPLLRGPIDIMARRYFSVGSTDLLCPEASEMVSESGAVIHNLYSPHYFDTRERNAPTAGLQPLRITIKGTDGTPDPWVRRARTLGSYYEPILQSVSIASGGIPGQIQYRAGNEMFGTGFRTAIGTRYFWLANGTATGEVSAEGNLVISGGTYRAYGTRGPLSNLESMDLLAYDGQYNNVHSFIIWPKGNPAGWTTFDVPGPSQASGGGYLPGEKLASALAEMVQVVGHTEKDLGTDGPGLYNDFKHEFNAAGFPAADLTAIGDGPFVVGARTSELTGFGTVTSLFTPQSSRYRFGGALQPDNWTLADFITQAKGTYTIIHQPRSGGLFGLLGQPVVSDPVSWWNGSGVYANGARNGQLDAIELLRGEGFDKLAPDSWFQQFLQVRSDWFALLNQQTPQKFTKALGLSSAAYSLDTPVGLARTYLKAAPALTNPPVAGIVPTQPLVQDLSSVLAALQSGAAVASTGPFLDVTVGSTGPGGLVAGPMATASVRINLWHSDWMPVDELRIVVNGTVVSHIDPATLEPSGSDGRVSGKTFQVPMPDTGTGAWIVVEAGVRETQTGPYAAGTPWYEIMRGIYPIAVTNPIFIDVTGTGYTHP